MSERVKPYRTSRKRDLGSSREAQLAAKREAIVAAAVRQFAEHGYEGARVEAIAAELGIAKGSVFAHFESKAGLFLAAYKAAVRSLARWQDAPPETLDAGFFATVRYWLDRTGHLVRDDWTVYRATLIGNHGTDLAIKREVVRFLADEDPYGTQAFVRWGIERGEIRDDLSSDLVTGVLDWLAERFQDAQVTDELDPGLFRRASTADQARRVDEFVELLRSAIGTRTTPGGGADGRRGTVRPAARAART
jgi:AcrR family transcriptional regulator